MTKIRRGSWLFLFCLFLSSSCSDEGGEETPSDEGSVTDTASDSDEEVDAVDSTSEVGTDDAVDDDVADAADDPVEDAEEVGEDLVEEPNADSDTGEIDDADVPDDIADADTDFWEGFDVTFGDVIDSGPPPTCDTTVVVDICGFVCSAMDICFSSGGEACVTGCTENLSNCTTEELGAVCTCISTHLTCAAFETWNACMNDITCVSD